MPPFAVSSPSWVRSRRWAGCLDPMPPPRGEPRRAQRRRQRAKVHGDSSPAIRRSQSINCLPRLLESGVCPPGISCRRASACSGGQMRVEAPSCWSPRLGRGIRAPACCTGRTRSRSQTLGYQCHCCRACPRRGHLTSPRHQMPRLARRPLVPATRSRESRLRPASAVSAVATVVAVTVTDVTVASAGSRRGPVPRPRRMVTQ
jgi:hypothetical protein